MKLDLKKLIIACCAFIILSLGIIGITYGINQHFMSKGNEENILDDTDPKSLVYVDLTDGGGGCSGTVTIKFRDSLDNVINTKTYNCYDSIPISDLKSIAQTFPYYSDFVGWYRDNGTRYYPGDSAASIGEDLNPVFRATGYTADIYIMDPSITGNSSQVIAILYVKIGETITPSKINKLMDLQDELETPTTSIYKSSYFDDSFPYKYGYSFDGYYDTKTLDTKITSISPTKDTYLYTGWSELTKHKVTFYLSYTEGEYAVKMTPNGYKVDMPDNPSRDGWYFVGWYTDPNYNNIFNYNSSITSDTDLYAKWSNAALYTHTIIFKANGGTGTMVNQTKNSSDSIATIKLNKNTYKFGTRAFIGWNTNANGSGTSYDDEGTLTYNNYSNGSTTLYAQWETAVRYDKNTNATALITADGITSSTGKYVRLGEKYNTLATGKRTGYEFGGWYSNADCSTSNRVTSATTVTNYADHSLYAKWTPIQYQVILNKNGGSGTNMATLYIDYDNEYELPANTYTKSNCTFAGWNTKANGSGTSYINGARVKNLSTDQDGEVTLYAQWTCATPTEYKVTYYKNDGTTTNTVKTTTGSFTTLSNTYWTRSGYTFNTWYTNSNGTGGSVYTANQSYSTSKNLSLYAQWKANNYTVTFNPLGGTLSSYNNKTVTYNENYGTLPVPKKDNYNFVGWYIDNVTFTNQVTLNTKYLTAGNTTLYAKYSPITVEVTFNPLGGTVDEQKRIVNKGSAIGTLPAASKTNDGFLGWYADMAFDYQLDKNTTIDSSMTVYAKYQSDILELNTYTQYSTYKFENNDYILFTEKQKTNILKPANTGYTLDYKANKDRNDITYIGTGDSLKLYKTSNPLNNKEYTIIVLGDANGDGEVNSGDLYFIQLHLLNRRTLTGAYKGGADANKDSEVNSGDLYAIQRYLVGKGSLPPVVHTQ